MKLIDAEEMSGLSVKITNAVHSPCKGKVIFYRQKNGKLEFLMGKELVSVKSQKYIKFNMIGGTCDSGESVIDCACRELYEETIGLLNPEIVRAALIALPRQNIGVFKLKGSKVFCFFAPMVSHGGDSAQRRTVQNDDIVKQFQTRKMLLKSVFEPESAEPQTAQLTLDLRLKIKKELGLQRDVEKISKTFLKHFYELFTIEWIDETKLMDYEHTNTRLIHQLTHIYDPVFKKEYAFRPSHRSDSSSPSKSPRLVSTEYYIQLLKKSAGSAGSATSASIQSPRKRRSPSPRRKSPDWKLVTKKK